MPLVRAVPAVVIDPRPPAPAPCPSTFGPVKRRWLALDAAPRGPPARLVVTLSEFTARRRASSASASPADRIRVVRHGIDPPTAGRGRRDRRAVRRRYGLGGQLLRVPGDDLAPQEPPDAGAGLRGRWPRTDPTSRLVLTGAAAEAEDEVRAEIGRLGLDGRVRRTGRIPRADLDALFAGAAARHRSRRASRASAPRVLEAMALGAARSSASDATALPEVVGDAGVLLDPLDVGGLDGGPAAAAGRAATAAPAGRGRSAPGRRAHAGTNRSRPSSRRGGMR